MGIRTGRGDSGDTDFRGERVSKGSPFIEALGGIDELQAFLADAAHLLPQSRATALRAVVSDCSEAMAIMAGFGDARAFGDGKARILEEGIGEMEKVFERRGFVIPGKTPASAKLDICRTVCRRAERSFVAARGRTNLEPEIGLWLNRLSDYLFLMARLSEDQPEAP